jgi:hypothetical protein
MAIVEVIHFTDYATQLVSVDFGEDQVEEYDVRYDIGEQVKGGNTVSGGDHIVPGRFQVSHEVFEKNPVIVDQKDFHFISGSLSFKSPIKTFFR